MLNRPRPALAFAAALLAFTAPPALAGVGKSKCSMSCSAKEKLEVVQTDDGYAIQAKKEAAATIDKADEAASTPPVRVGRGARIDSRLFGRGSKDAGGKTDAPQR